MLLLSLTFAPRSTPTVRDKVRSLSAFTLCPDQGFVVLAVCSLRSLAYAMACCFAFESCVISTCVAESCIWLCDGARMILHLLSCYVTCFQAEEKARREVSRLACDSILLCMYVWHVFGMLP